MYSQNEIHLNLAKIRWPAPSYLSFIFRPAARGVNAEKIRRLRKAFSGVKLVQQKAGLANVKYGRCLRKSSVNGAGRNLQSRRNQ